MDACRAIVDELANAETTGSGKEQLARCELQYQQVVFLWERIWPEVNGMGEEEDLADEEASPDRQRSNSMAGPSGTNGTQKTVTKADPIEIEDDDDNNDRDDDAPTDMVDSPYGGTGLGAIAAANHVA